MKKIPGHIIISHKCTINYNHMTDSSFKMKRDRQKCFDILGHFLPFYPTNNRKNQSFEKIKKTTGDIIILHKCTKNHHQVLYCS